MVLKIVRLKKIRLPLTLQLQDSFWILLKKVETFLLKKAKHLNLANGPNFNSLYKNCNNFILVVPSELGQDKDFKVA